MLKKSSLYLISDEKPNISSYCINRLLQIILAYVMMGYGESNKGDCNNRATDYLVTGSIITLCSNLIKAESCVIKMLLLINSLLQIIDICIAIWLSVYHNKHPSFIMIPALGQCWCLGPTVAGHMTSCTWLNHPTAPSLL